MAGEIQKSSSRTLTWGTIPSTVPSLLRDLPILLAALAFFYAILSMTHYWMTPAGAPMEIHLEPSALPRYAMFSVLRIAAAYLVSLAFTLVYGYVAAYNARAEKFMVPLLDTLQSIPVLSFLPGVMVAMVALFPTKQLGVELGSILLIFTGQVWNMTFSFYSSLKSIPREMREVAEIYHWSWWQRFTQMELPYSIIGLVWNSMMSVAGGWFFLMACEMFTLGDRDLRLPGLGSYLQTAANAGNTRAIWWGMGVMIGIIVVIDQLVWRPVIAWAEKFKFEQVESTDAPRSAVLDLLRSSRILPFFSRLTVRPAREFLSLHFARSHAATSTARASRSIYQWLTRLLLAALLAGIVYESARMVMLLAHLTREELRGIFLGAGATFLRVAFTLFLAGAVDHSRGNFDRPEAETFGHRAADCAGGGFGAGHRAFSDHFAGADPRGRRPGHRFNHAAAAGHAVVHPVQRDRGGHRYPHGFERSVLRFSIRQDGALAGTALAGNFSVLDHRICDGLGRRVERQHRRGIFQISRAYLPDHRTGSGDQQRHGHGKYSRAAGGNDSDGGNGGDDQPAGLAEAVPAGVDAVPAGELNGSTRSGL